MDQQDPFRFVRRPREKISSAVTTLLLRLLLEKVGQTDWEAILTSLHDWLGVTPPTVMDWLEGNVTPLSGGINTVLQQGWIESISNDPQNPRPTTLQEALWSALKSRAVSVEDLEVALGTKTHTIIRWLYGEAAPHYLTRIKLEYQLHRVRRWSNPSYEQLGSPLKGLARLLAAGSVSVDQCLSDLGISRDRLFDWLRNDLTISSEFTSQIEDLVYVVTMEEVDSEEGPEAPIEQSPHQPVWPSSLAVYPSTTDMLDNLLEHTAAYLEYFLRHSTPEDRDRLRERNPELIFELGNALAAASSEESHRRWLQRSQRGNQS